MKRDMDIVRYILLELEDSKQPLRAQDISKSDEHRSAVAWHMKLMIDAGLIEGKCEVAFGGDIAHATAKSITWTGYDFLDAVRSDDVWTKTKKTIAKHTVSAPFEVVKTVAIQIGVQYLMAKIKK